MHQYGLNDNSTIDQKEDRYNQFLSILTVSAQNTLLNVEKKAKQTWMTQDILLNMEKRRMEKSNIDEYNKLDK